MAPQPSIFGLKEALHFPFLLSIDIAITCPQPLLYTHFFRPSSRKKMVIGYNELILTNKKRSTWYLSLYLVGRELILFDLQFGR